MKVLNYQEVEDILFGCTIMGTGGGGSLKDGITAVKNAFDKDKSFQMLEFKEIEDNKYYVNPYYCGSINPEVDEDKTEEAHNQESELEIAIRGLEEYMGTEFQGLISVEYGGGNTGQCMAAAAMLGKVIVDADAAGRAVPELQFSTYSVTGQPIFPFAVATKYGDIAIFTQVASDERAEALARHMAVATDNLVGIADHPIKGFDLKKSVIPNALSFAQKVGEARRKAIEVGDNPIDAILKATKGKLLCEGIVTGENTHWDIKDGFTTGEIGIDGMNSFEKRKYKIWYRNENMIIWEDEHVKMTCPDLICVVNLSDGYPITNPNCNKGDKVAVFGVEAHKIWKSKKGLNLLNPNFFGFDNIDIVDISNIE